MKPTSIILLVVAVLALGILSYFGVLFFTKQSINNVNINSIISPNSQVSVTGVLKYGVLLSPVREYCGNGLYIDSIDGKPLHGSDYSLLVDLTSGINFQSLAYNSIDNVVTLKGNIINGQNCNPKNSCSCDNKIQSNAFTGEAALTNKYIASLPTYEGTITCLASGDNPCIPILNTSSGKKYQLIDLNGNYSLDQDGKKVKVWASYDGVDTQADSQTVDGTLYVDNAQ